MSPGQIAYGTCRRKFKQHAFELAVLINAAFAGLDYLIDSRSGERSSIGEQVAPFDSIWSIFYVLAAVMVVTGICRETQRFRVAGLSMFMCGALMQFVAAVSITPLELRDTTYLVFAAAAFFRANEAARTVIPRRTHDSGPATT